MEKVLPVFYSQADSLLKEMVEGDPQLQNNETPSFWKGLGDSVVFSCPFKSPQEFAISTRAFLNLFERYGKEMKSRFDLDLKFCIWHATFPDINLELKIRGGVDYIGPDMDVGFRLANVVEEKRCFIAMDSVIELAQSQVGRSLFFLHIGWKKLKGVRRERNYPVLQVMLDSPYWSSDSCDGFLGIKGEGGLGLVTPEKATEIIQQYKRELGFDPTKV